MCNRGLRVRASDLRRKFAGRLLRRNCIRGDKADPELIDRYGIVFSENLLDSALNGGGKFREWNLGLGHPATSRDKSHNSATVRRFPRQCNTYFYRVIFITPGYFLI